MTTAVYSGPMWKDMGPGRQPASLSPVSTVLTIYGSDESMTLPCVTSTKVIEVKEMLAGKLGVDPTTISFVTRQGCANRKQYDHEEIRRNVTVVGIKSFTRQKERYVHPMVIIGAGHIGLRHGLWFLKYKMENFVIIDRRNQVGGTSWIAQANKTSKLQTELGTYHLQYDEENPVPTNMPTWPSRDQLLEHFHEVCEQYGLMPYIKLNTNVKRLDITGTDSFTGTIAFHLESTDGNYRGVDPPEPTGRGIEAIQGTAAFYYPGNLTIPKRVDYKGEDEFGGPIAYALHNEFDYTATTGANVVVCGHGAFGVENVRTCCEFDARKIFLLCRRKNLACPRMVSWLANQSALPVSAAMFLRGLSVAYGILEGPGWDPWGFHSVSANEARTQATIVQKSRFGIGDVYFLAVYMGKCEVVVDDVKRISAGVVHLQSGRKLEASVILKVFGFNGDWEVDKLLQVKSMYGYWPDKDNRRYIASEGPGVSASNFGGTSLSPGAIAWVEQATHFMDFPRDWTKIVQSGMLPVHKAEPEIDRPAYVIEARTSTAIGMIVPGFCPEIAERGSTVYAWLKRTRQLECHPLKAFLAEAEAEWHEYGKAWKRLDPSLKDPPPYPYTVEMVQAWVDETDGRLQ